MARMNFTNDMRELKHELAEMGGMAEEAIEKVIRALKNKPKFDLFLTEKKEKPRFSNKCHSWRSCIK